jgi:drug/metabolite transporter (DMT)-like permease
MSVGSSARTGTGTATAIGFVAVLLWALLALLTASTGSVPPFQLVAMSFTVASVAGLAYWIATGADIAERLRLPPLAWLLGTGGLFGYHFFYFLALRNAPPVEASLIAYLWPLLIVLMSGLLPGAAGGLRWWHLAGVGLGLVGAGLLVTGGRGVAFQSQYMPGYGAALVCALTWSAYSVLSRLFGEVRSDAVTGFCMATAVLAALCHLALEETVWPAAAGEWLAVLALGVGPAGLAFYVWDHGVKRGDIRVLGAASYASPLLSTLVLVAFGMAQAGWVLGVACLAITAGAVLAARDMLFARRGS